MHQSLRIYDRLIIDDEAKVRFTPDGYMTAMPRVARTGIQIYAGREVGRPDLERVRVYRPESEVFSKDSLRSYAHRPMTNDHPRELVTADNWKKYAVGSVGDEIVRDGRAVRVPMTLMDAEAVRDYREGKTELSLGYLCDLKWESGKTEDGETYDAVQTSIRANHLALVKAARGGPDLRIGDDKPGIINGDNAMTDKTIVVDGVTLTMTDTAAQVVARFMDSSSTLVASLRKQIADNESEEEKRKKKEEGYKKDAAALQTTIANKDAEIATLKQQVQDATLTPAKLDAAVKVRDAVISKAKAVLGDKLIVDGKTDGEIRRQVVDARLGDVAKGWGDGEIATSFATITVDVKPETATTDAIARGFAQPTTPAGDKRGEAYVKYDQSLQDAWRTPAPTQ